MLTGVVGLTATALALRGRPYRRRGERYRAAPVAAPPADLTVATGE